MRLRTIIRTNSGAWIAIPLALMAIFYAAKFVTSGLVDAYAPSITAKGLASLGFVAPLCAALGAWEAGRLRRARWWDLPAVRHPAAIIAQTQGPIVVAGVLAIMAGTALGLVSSGVLLPDVRPLVVGVTVVSAHTILGAALGRWLPVVIATPAALLSSFAFIVMLRALDPMWLRYLGGLSIELCCGTGDDLAPGAVFGPLAVAGGLIVASYVLLAARRVDWPVASAGGLALLAGLSVGGSLVSSLGSYPTVPRDIAALECSGRGTDLVVCLWPEHRALRSQTETTAREAIDRWRRAGLEVPRVVSEGNPDSRKAGELTFSIASASKPSQILEGLANGMLPSWSTCANGGATAGSDTREYVLAWLLATAGMAQDDLATRFPDIEPPDPALFPDTAGMSVPPSVLTVVQRVRSLPPEAQLVWVRRNLVALSNCDGEPEILPPG